MRAGGIGETADRDVCLIFRLLVGKDICRVLVLAVIAVAAVFTVACGSKPAAPDPRLTVAGALFQKNCATCHGPDGDGQTIAGKAIPSLKIGKPLTDPDSRLTQQITNGGNGMPPFKYTLTDDEIQQLLRYVRGELQQPKKKI